MTANATTPETVPFAEAPEKMPDGSYDFGGIKAVPMKIEFPPHPILVIGPACDPCKCSGQLRLTDKGRRAVARAKLDWAMIARGGSITLDRRPSKLRKALRRAGQFMLNQVRA